MAKGAKFTASTDANGLDRRFRRGVLAVRGETEHAMRRMRDAGEEILAFHAPFESGRLAEGIRGVIRGRQVLVFTARAVDPDSGFDYVAVTRFGHRVERIYPGQKARSVTSPVAVTSRGTRRIAPVGGAKVLNTKLGFFGSVKGYRPARDWVERGVDEIEDLAGREAEVIGRGVARTIAR